MMRVSAKIFMVLGIALAAMLLSCVEAGAQKIAIKTNTLELAALTPNFGIETVIGEKTSIDISIMGHSRPYGFPSQMLSLQPEFRLWLSGRPMVNAFIGSTVHASMHEITMRGQFHAGFSFGLGVTAGYVLAIARKLNLEFTGGLAATYFFQEQQTVADSDHLIPVPVNTHGYKILPIDIGVTLTYIIR